MIRKDFINLFGKHFVVWFEHNWLIIVLVLFLIAQYFIAQKVKLYLERKYRYLSSDDPGSTNYMLYYKKNQVFDLVRLALSVACIAYVLVTYQSWFFSVFAIWIWAMVLTFQSVILSFGIYFYLLSQYRVGDTVKIGDIAQWEIMYIEPLYMAIAEKNDDADHTGKLYVISNKTVWENPIVRVKLSLRSYSKHIIRIGYEPWLFSCSFEEFIQKIEQFLNSTLPQLPKKAYNHYQSYVGFKYKLDFEPGEMRNSGQVMYIDIWFIVMLIDLPHYKREIMWYIDSLRVHDWDL